MKKVMLSLAALSVFAIAGINATTLPGEATVLVQETTKIDPESLPEKVKEAIKTDDAVSLLTIKEAHQKMEEGQVVYQVIFESSNPGEEVKKMYDAAGKEVAQQKAVEPIR